MWEYLELLISKMQLNFLTTKDGQTYIKVNNTASEINGIYPVQP